LQKKKSFCERINKEINKESLAINTKDYKLVCECSPEEMNTAVQECGAKILKAFSLKSFKPTRI
jgi:hypothetical protein